MRLCLCLLSQNLLALSLIVVSNNLSVPHISPFQNGDLKKNLLKKEEEEEEEGKSLYLIELYES